MTKRDILPELRKRYERLRAEPFPEGSTDEEVDVLRAYLIEYDGYLAGILDRLTGGERMTLRDIHFNADLRRRLETIVKDVARPGAVDARRYLDQLLAMEKLVRDALSK